MTGSGINSRELILDILLEIEEGAPSHIAVREALAKHQFLPKQDRAFITRVIEGTLEYQLQLDYILNLYSNVTVGKMKPVIREILRMSVYQLKYMDSVPDSAVVNEAVNLTQKRGFYNLKAFVNGVLRNIARELDSISWPDREEDAARYLSIRYSMPPYLTEKWIADYGEETTEAILRDFVTEKPLTVRCRTYLADPVLVRKSLEAQGVRVEPSPYLPYAFRISGYDHLMELDAFRDGKIIVQDVSSMLAAEAAAPKRGDYVLDLCAAPGGKSLHMGDKMEGYGQVDARDISEAKVALIEENIQRMRCINVQARVQDATVFDPESELIADIVLADVPCSGYGVIGKKPEIKYRMTPQRQEEIVGLQRLILDRAQEYVKSRGVLIYRTCTIAKEENEENMMWFLNHYPSFRLESLDPYLPEALHCESTALGYLQLLPGIHGTDGFFIARFRRK